MVVRFVMLRLPKMWFKQPTGHMVISTIHTGEAAGAVGRMLVGYLPLLSSTLVGVIAQRLVRKVCSFCAVDDHLSTSRSNAEFKG